MYQSGKIINRYAAKKHHQKVLKRRFTPKYYRFSYDNFCRACELSQNQIDLWLFCHLNDEAWQRHLQQKEKKLKNGRKDHYEKWWKQNTGSGKKNLKEQNSRTERRFYKAKCKIFTNSSYSEEEDYEIIPKKKFADPWDWID